MFITHLLVIKLKLMSQVNSVKSLRLKRSKRLALNIGQTRSVDTKNSS